MNWPRLVFPAVILCAFVLVVPVALPHDGSPVSDEDCLTMADRPFSGTDTGALERCRALEPDDVELWADLGTMHESAGRLAQAEDAYRRALALDPDYAEIRLRLGRLLLGRGAAAAAVQEAEAALKVQPNRQALIDLLHAAAEQLGRTPE